MWFKRHVMMMYFLLLALAVWVVATDRLIPDPFYEVRIAPTGMVVVRDPVTHAEGAVCAVSVAGRERITQVVCGFSDHDPTVNSGAARALLSDVDCEPDLHRFLSYCNFADTSIGAMDCPGDKVVYASCVRGRSLESYLEPSKVDAVLVFPSSLALSRVQSSLADLMEISERRIDMQLLPSCELFCLASVIFRSLSMDEALLIRLGDGSGDADVTTTATPATTTATPATTTTTEVPTTSGVTTTNFPPTSTITLTNSPVSTSTPLSPLTAAPVATTMAPRRTNDDLPAEALVHLLDGLSVSRLLSVGIFELRTGSTAECSVRNESEATTNLTFTQLDLNAIGPVKKVGAWVNGVLGTVCGSWTDDDAAVICSESSSGKRGFIVHHVCDNSSNQWPILVYKNSSGIHFSNCTNKQNNCSHIDDVGVLCSKRPDLNDTRFLRFTTPTLENSTHFSERLAEVIPSSHKRVQFSASAFWFTQRCSNRLPSRQELQALLLSLNANGLGRLGLNQLSFEVLSVNDTCDQSSSHTQTPTLSRVCVQIFIYVDPANVTTPGAVFDILQSKNLSVASVVEIRSAVFLACVSSIASAIHIETLITSGLVRGLLSASLEDVDGVVRTESNSLSLTVAVAVSCVCACVVVAICVLCVMRRRGGKNTAPSSDYAMNTLFLPLNLDDVEEWKPE